MSQTHFGFKTVDEKDKARHVRSVFDSVASNYDIMNDLMSAGLHRIWKAYTIQVANPRPGDRVLDIAGGTGDPTWPSRPRSRPMARWCTPTSTRPCCARAATGCSTTAMYCRPGLRCREAALPEGYFDIVTKISACAT